MTPAQPDLSQRLGHTLGHLLTHALLVAVVIAVLAVTYPALLRQVVPAGSAASEQLPRLVPSARGGVGLAVVGAVGDGPVATADLDIAASVAPTMALVLATDGDLLKVPQAQTIIPVRPRKELITYTVKEGDNLSVIAERYGVDVDTLIWANGKLEEDPDYLVVGQKLVIPPVSGVLHTVKDGDTLESIARQYKGAVRTMLELEFNRLTSAATVPISGTQIMVPGGEKPYQPRLVYIDGRAVMVNAPRGVGRFVWPAQGWITQYWSPTHRAIDIGAPEGTPIYASDSGVVVLAGWNGSYGITLIIDHGNGFQTLYAHLLAYYPGVGQNVRRGQAIGKMGNTGKSTGPHLHFEIRYQGGNVNPMRYLPQ